MSTADLESRIIETLKTIFDPELPVNIYDLGLIYKVDVQADNHVHIDMTLTTPACPVAGILPLQIETKVKVMEGVNSAKVDVVWDPPWTPEMMSEATRLTLNLDSEPKRRPGEPPQKYVGIRTPDRR
jgi:FeS assembly SUF system protein